jgi:hypothetical protein
MPMRQIGRMTLTKKHFIRAAAIVNAIREGNWTNELPSWGRNRSGVSPAVTGFERAVYTAEALVLLFSENNPRFDTNRFLVACGLLEAPAKASKRKAKV